MERLAPEPSEPVKIEDPDKHELLRQGYIDKLPKNVRIRRKAIEKAILKDCYDSVYRKMETLQDTLGRDYKEQRLQEDMNWLKSNSHRYIQSIF